MDPNVQGSFIPKQALSAQTRGGGMGLFFLVSLIIFALSLVGAGGAFAYTGILKGQLKDKDASLQLEEGAFDAGTIQDLLRTDSRIEQAKLLLQKHVSTVGIFTLLSQITEPNVQFTSMNLALNPDGSGTLTLSGSADSFATVALQSDAFGASKVLRDVIFSGIAVGQDSKVSFSVNATVESQVLLYSRSLSGQDTSVQTQPQTQQPAAQ